MALFIANLAFKNPADLDAAKLGVHGESVIAGVVGLLVLLTTSKQIQRYVFKVNDPSL